MQSKLDRLEKVVTSHPYLGFNNAAHSPAAQDDPFDVNYLDQSRLATVPSFGFATPARDDNRDSLQLTPSMNGRLETTTWDLLNLGDDLPQMAGTIRETFLGNQQVPSSAVSGSFVLQQ